MSDLDKIFSNMDANLAGLVARVDEAVQAAGVSCEGKTKQKCPVGTPESTGIKGYIGGRLRSSYQYKRTGKCECKIGTDVFYSWYIELGTPKMKARPHLLPSAFEAGRELIDELESIGVSGNVLRGD